jgi:hypothetical protein
MRTVIWEEKMDFTTLMSTVEELNGKELPNEAHGLIADHIARNIQIVQQGAMSAQDENHRAQLRELGLLERFPSLTHLADDMGEQLLKAERECNTFYKAVLKFVNTHGQVDLSGDAIKDYENLVIVLIASHAYADDCQRLRQQKESQQNGTRKL